MRFRALTAVLVGTVGMSAGALEARDASDGPLLAQYWQTELPFRTGDSAVSVDLIDEALYVATRSGDLHAIDPDVGLVRWSRSVTERGRKVFRPHHMMTLDGQPAALVAHDGGAFVYERDTGNILGKIPEMWPAGSPAVGDAVSLYAGSSDGFLYAVQWYNPTHRQPIRTWKVLGDGPVTAAPILIDDVLYFASQGGSVYACTADWDKHLHWEYATEAAIVADPFADESGVYVASLDRSLYRLNLASGALMWRHRFPQPLRDRPVVSQRTVYQHCRGHGLYAIDVDTHAVFWTHASGTAFVSRLADRTCVRTDDDRVVVLDSARGSVRDSMPIPSKALVTANPDGLAFYVVAPTGEVRCYTSADTRHLRADDLLKRLASPGAPGLGDRADAAPGLDGEAPSADGETEAPAATDADR
ncbi:MAG: PQQ-binding-like beta-propeller repeat protein [bacterium]|nr:PQQ-binding-like beta-propeller repeat protein [bacterium]